MISIDCAPVPVECRWLRCWNVSFNFIFWMILLSKSSEKSQKNYFSSEASDWDGGEKSAKPSNSVKDTLSTEMLLKFQAKSNWFGVVFVIYLFYLILCMDSYNHTDSVAIVQFPYYLEFERGKIGIRDRENDQREDKQTKKQTYHRVHGESINII